MVGFSVNEKTKVIYQKKRERLGVTGNVLVRVWAFLNLVEKSHLIGKISSTKHKLIILKGLSARKSRKGKKKRLEEENNEK